MTTDKDGNISVEGLFPATYTITEQSIDRYEPQESQTVTLIGGKTTTVNFNNHLEAWLSGDYQEPPRINWWRA